MLLPQYLDYIRNNTGAGIRFSLTFTKKILYTKFLAQHNGMSVIFDSKKNVTLLQLNLGLRCHSKMLLVQLEISTWN